MEDLQLPIAEVFTDTIQGEGATTGRLSSFVRFVGCHRSCSYCDTKYAWKLEGEKAHLETIQAILLTAKARNLVLTGGEPLLHQDKP